MIALIPARGGSKGLPGKNIKELGDKPLIAYSIQSAIKAKCIERVVVTTDDRIIADIARKYGADVPFIRPAKLATDTACAIDVYLHAMDFFMKENRNKIDKFMVLLPTVPFRTEKHIEEAYELFEKEKARTLISVTKAEAPPSWYLQRNNEGRLYNCGFGINNGVMNNRQEDQGYFIPNGAIYILDYKLLKNKRTYYCNNTVAYEMSEKDSVDIDTLEDFEYAQYILQRNK